MLQKEESNNIPFELTICIVTYEKDFDLLDRLISSLCLYWETSNLTILIILNDNKETEIELENILNKYLYTDIKIETIWANNIFDLKQYDWFSQQTIKLLIADYIRTSWFMILDSKNYFKFSKEKIKISDFFSNEGKAYGSWGLSTFYFKDAYESAYKLWNLDPPIKENTLNEFTPILLKTDMMKELILELKYRFKSLLPDICRTHLHKGGFFLTEFAIMSAFIKYKEMDKVLYEHVKFNDDAMKKLGKTLRSDKNIRRS